MYRFYLEGTDASSDIDAYCYRSEERGEKTHDDDEEDGRERGKKTHYDEEDGRRFNDELTEEEDHEENEIYIYIEREREREAVVPFV